MFINLLPVKLQNVMLVGLDLIVTKIVRTHGFEKDVSQNIIALGINAMQPTGILVHLS